MKAVVMLALVLACTGSASSRLVGDGGVSGPRRGREEAGVPLADVRSGDLAVAPDVVADAPVIPDARPGDLVPVPADAMVLLDVARPVDARPVDVGPGFADAISVVDARTSDAGAGRCSAEYMTAVRGVKDWGASRCNYLRTAGHLAYCYQDATGTLAATCRYEFGSDSVNWYVRRCIDCEGLDAWEKFDGGAL